MTAVADDGAHSVVETARERRIAYLIGELCRDDVHSVRDLAAAFEREVAVLEGRAIDADQVAQLLGIDPTWVLRHASALGGWRDRDRDRIMFDAAAAAAAYDATRGQRGEAQRRRR